MTSILLAGVGSAGIRFGRAAEILGWKPFVFGGPKSIHNYRLRYTYRYGCEPRSCSEFMDKIQFDYAVIATPPRSHNVVALRVGDAMRANNPTPSLIIEKPMMIPSEGLKELSAYCDSQMVWEPGFQDFAQQVVDRNAVNPLQRLEAEFIDTLEGSIKAHGWNQNFSSGWLLDEDEGGGALFEFSHPLFWIGEILGAIGSRFPELELHDYCRQVGPKGTFTSLVVLSGQTQGVLCSSRQEIVRSAGSVRKRVTAYFQSGSKLSFSWAQNVHPEEAAEQTARYLALIHAGSKLQHSSGANEKARWVDTVLTKAWRVLRNTGPEKPGFDFSSVVLA